MVGGRTYGPVEGGRVVSRDHRTPTEDLKHTVNRDALLTGLYMGSKLDEIKRLQQEQTYYARLQWWNALTPEQQTVELAKAQVEQERREADAIERRRDTRAVEAGGLYWASRIAWFVVLLFGLAVAAIAAWPGSASNVSRWWIFVIYLVAATVAYFGPLRGRARGRRARRKHEDEIEYQTAVEAHGGARVDCAVESHQPTSAFTLNSVGPGGSALPSLPATDAEWGTAQADLEAIQERWKWDANDLPEATKALVPYVIGLDFGALSMPEVAAVRQFLAGVEHYDPGTRISVAQGLADNVRKKVTGLPVSLMPAFVLIAAAAFVDDDASDEERSGHHSHGPFGAQSDRRTQDRAGQSQPVAPADVSARDGVARLADRDAPPYLPSLVIDVRCPDCEAINDVSSLPNMCFRCGATLSEGAESADLEPDVDLADVRDAVADLVSACDQTNGPPREEDVLAAVEEVARLVEAVDPSDFAPDERASMNALLAALDRHSELAIPNSRLAIATSELASIVRNQRNQLADGT
jgi:hypothetical protein